MAMIDDSHYLVVHDDLSFETGARISVLRVEAEKNYAVTPVRPNNWEHKEGRSSDLEGVCALPEREQEFLLVEAGHYDGKYGRMFHVKVDIAANPYRLEVLRAFDVPEFDPKSRDDDGDEIEGIACASMGDGRPLVILGETRRVECLPDRAASLGSRRSRRTRRA